MEMVNVKNKFCRLCLKGVNHFEEIGQCIKEVLEVVLLKLDLDAKDVMCNECSVKLLEAFNFKVMCVDTEDSIVPYVASHQDIPIDLKEIYLKIKGDIQPNYILDVQKICRLCFELIKYEFVSVDEVQTDVINNYIPEVNFSATKNPIICIQCFYSLNRHSGFLKSCSDVEIKIKNMFTVLGQKEEIEIKREIIGGKDRNQFEDANKKCVPTLKKKLQRIKPLRSMQVYKCDTCGYKTNNPYHFKRHQLLHNKRIYKCTECKFKIYDKKKFIRHQLKHNTPLFRCSKCKFRTKYKQSLTLHESRHKTGPRTKTLNCEESKRKTKESKIKTSDKPRQQKGVDTEMHKCNLCKYETKYKGNLKQHKLRHQIVSQAQTYKCDKCKFETEIKKHLISHKMQQHQGCKIYKCSHCHFESKYKQSLQKHAKRHEDPQMRTFKCNKSEYQNKHKFNSTFHQPNHKICKCDKCEYETKLKKTLNDNQITDKYKMYTCLVCKYRSYNRSDFVRHQLMHIEVSEVQLHACDKCDFKTKFKKNLKRHMLVHQQPFKPMMLDSKTKDKASNDKQKVFICGYTSSDLINIKTNDLMHNDVPGAQLYTCDKCDFKSKFKCNLKRHLLVHEKATSKRVMLKCSKRDYKTKDKKAVNDNPKVYTCHMCKYSTGIRTNFVTHQLKHTNVPKTQLFACDKCDYKSKLKGNIKRHLLVHEKGSEQIMPSSHQNDHIDTSQTFQCSDCGFIAKRYNNLMRHRVVHKKSSGV